MKQEELKAVEDQFVPFTIEIVPKKKQPTGRQIQSTNQKLQVIETRNISPLKTETATDGKRVVDTDREITAALTSNRIVNQSSPH